MAEVVDDGGVVGEGLFDVEVVHVYVDEVKETVYLDVGA